ncbi:MAG: WG repeat-containing protein [Dethiobacteraceae bacterium]
MGVLLKDKWGFLDKNGNFVIQPTYEDVYPFTEEGLARAKTDGKWGFIDTKGNVVIDFIYDYVYDFSDETALVRDGDTFFYINTEGKKINDLIITRRN